MRQLDEQYKTLFERWERVPHHDPFAEAVARFKLRPEMEALAADYLAQLDTENSVSCTLRLLGLFELFRSPEVGLQSFRMAGVGKRIRARWPLPTSSAQRDVDIRHAHGASVDTVARRVCLRSDIVDPQDTSQSPHHEAEGIEIWNSASYPQEPLSYENVILVHCGFVGDDLVTVLDGNLSLFVYGDDAMSTRSVQSRWFSDYSYDPARMKLGHELYPPIVKKGVRSALLDCASRVHAVFSNEHDPAALKSAFDRVMAQLDDLLSFAAIESYVSLFARDRRVGLNDVCVVWLPFDFLFRLPLAFLGHSLGRPLLRSVGGVSCALSLVTMKYSVMKYHWMRGLNPRGRVPRCVMFSADPTHTLDLNSEVRLVESHFAKQDIAVFRNASSSEFAVFSNAAEISWFCGHGASERQRSASSDQFQFLLSGPQFVDRMVSNFELISTGQYNFEPVWLMVMNCCALGESELVGSNPIGFMTATYASGAIGCVSNLWAIRDDAALIFADELAASIQTNYSRNDFSRARAVNDALRRCIEADPEEAWRFGSYALWGLP